MPERPPVPAPLRVGPFEIDLRARELRKDGRRIRIQDKPFELLATLLERPGEVVSRDELRQRLWPADTFVAFDDGLNTAINKAREALGDSAESPRFIETVPRRGYRFIAQVTGNGNGNRDTASEAIAASMMPAASAMSEAVAVPAAPPRRRTIVAVLGAIAAITVAVASVFAYRWRATPLPPMVRFQIQAPDGTRFPTGMTSFALSPDGRQVAFGAVSGANRVERIWVQSLSSSAVEMLPGTEGPVDICWSPDGQAIAFTAQGKLLRYDVRDKIVRPLTDHEVRGVTWSAEGGILFGRGEGHGLYLLSPRDGSSRAITTLDATREETTHLWPQWLPDGRSFIYLAVSRAPQRSGVYFARSGETARRLLLASAYGAVYAEPGFLLFSNDSRLMAQRFDAEQGRLIGEAVEVASGIATFPADGAVALSVSRSGTLAYATPPRLASRELVWVNRVGQALGTVAGADHYAYFSLSPDERFAALQKAMPEVEPAAPDLWALDLTRNVQSRMTNNPGNDEGAVWAADSRRFVYARHRGIRQRSDLYLKDVREPDRDQPLLADETGSKHPFDWSPDTRLLLYGLSQAKSARQDIWALPLDGVRPPFPWLATPFDEAEARFSPDGRWVAYESDETGIREVFVRAFRSPAVRVQISAGGGTGPQWSRDGGELYYVSADYRLMAVPVRAGASLEPDAPRPLFELRRLEAVPSGPTPYAVSADGKRFLIGALVDAGGPSPITVVLNWARLVDR